MENWLERKTLLLRKQRNRHKEVLGSITITMEILIYTFAMPPQTIYTKMALMVTLM